MEAFFVSGRVSAELPLWQAYPGNSLNGDYTNVAAPNKRALEVALQEAQFRVDAFSIVSMGGYAAATAIDDPLVGKYQRLDTRLESTPFDPSVPYFLDEEGAVQTITGRDKRPPDTTSDAKRRRWWQLWK